MRERQRSQAAAPQRLDWQALPTEELVEELKVTGLDIPRSLVEEIVRRGKDAVPALGRLAVDEDLWESEGEEMWAPLSALHLLGAIGDPSSATYVVGALRLDPDPDEIVENTPTIIGHLGPTVIPEFARFLLDEKAEPLMRGVAADGLASIALLHPQTRPAVIAFLRSFVEDAGKHDPVAVTGAILTLTELRDRESMPAIGKAFHAKRVDEDYIYLEDVLEAMKTPEALGTDWHYTGNPMRFFSPAELEKLKQKAEKQKHGR